ncbi:DUF4388 domain-containing protein [Acidobacteriota bacterium]
MAGTVLIADRDYRVRKFFRGVFESLGCRVEEFDQGSALLENFEVLEPDLIFLDAMLPVKDGLHSCRAIKDTLIGKSIPVIILTDIYPRRRPKERFFRHFGTTDFLCKPVSEEDLLKYNEKYLIRGEGVSLSMPNSNIEQFDFGQSLPVEAVARLHREGKSGLLYFEGPESSALIQFDGGEIVSARSNSPDKILGPFLSRTGKLGPDALQRIDEDAPVSDRVGAWLVKEKHLTEEELSSALMDLQSQVIDEVPGWRTGKWLFLADNQLTVEEPRFDGAIDRLLSRWLWRMDDSLKTLRVERMFKDKTNTAVLRPAEGYEDILNATRLTVNGLQVFSLVDGKKTLDRIQAISSVALINARPIIFKLITLGLVEPGRHSEAAVFKYAPSLESALGFETEDLRARPSGNLAEIQPFTLLSDLAFARYTGSAEMRSDGVLYNLSFDGGELTTITGEALESGYRRVLIEAGLVDSDEVEVAYRLHQDEPAKSFSQLLVELEYLNEGEPEAIEKLHRQRALFDILDWQKGTYILQPGAPVKDKPDAMGARLLDLLLEYTRRTNLITFVDATENKNAYFKLFGPRAGTAGFLRVTGEELDILSCFEGKFALQEISGISDHSRDEIHRVIKTFYDLGAIKKLETSSQVPSEKTPGKKDEKAGGKARASQAEKDSTPSSIQPSGAGSQLPALFGSGKVALDAESPLKMVKVQLVGDRKDFQDKIGVMESQVRQAEALLQEKLDENEFMDNRLRRTDAMLFKAERELFNAREDMKSAESRISELELLLAERDRESGDLRTMRDGLQSLVDGLRNEHIRTQREFEQKLNDKTDNLENLNTQLSEIRIILAERERELENLLEDRNELIAKNDKATADWKEKKQQFKQERAQREETIQKLKQKIATLITAGDERTTMLKTLTAERDGFIAKLEGAVAERMKDRNTFEEKLTAAEKEIRLVSTNLEQNQAKVAELERLKAGLEERIRAYQQEMAGEKKSHEDTRSTFQTAQGEWNQKHESLNKEQAILQQTLRSTRQQLELEKEKVAAFTTEIAERKQRISELEIKDGERVDLLVDQESKKGRIAELEREIEELQNMIRNLREALNEQKTGMATLQAEFEKQTQERQQEVKYFKNLLHEKTDEAKSIEEKLNRKENEMVRVIARAEERTNLLENRIVALSNTESKLRDDLRQNQEDIHHLKKDIFVGTTESEENVRKLSDELQQLLDKQRQYDEVMGLKDSQLSVLSEEMNSLRQDKHSVDDRLEERERAINTLQQKLSLREEQIVDLKDASRRNEEALSLVRSEVAELKSKHDQFEKEKEKAGQLIRAMETRIQERETLLKTTAKKKDQQKRILTDQEEVIASLKTHLSNYQKKGQAEMEGLKVKIARLETENRESNKTLTEKKEQLSEIREEVLALTSNEDTAQNRLAKREKELVQLRNEFSELRQNFLKRDRERSQLSDDLQTQSLIVEGVSETILAMAKQLEIPVRDPFNRRILSAVLRQVRSNYDSNFSALKKVIQEKDQELTRIATRYNKLSSVRKTAEDRLAGEATQYQTVINQKDRMIKDLENKYAQLQGMVEATDMEMIQRETNTSDLKGEIQKYQKMLREQSETYKSEIEGQQKELVHLRQQAEGQNTDTAKLKNAVREAEEKALKYAAAVRNLTNKYNKDISRLNELLKERESALRAMESERGKIQAQPEGGAPAKPEGAEPSGEQEG